MNVSTISLPSQISYGAAKVASDSADMETAKGKSGMPPGQMAKQAIAEAGLENAPANLHGKVTSALARGLDITSLLTVQENTVEDPAPVEVPTDGETGTSTDSPADNVVSESSTGADESIDSSGSNLAAALNDSEAAPDEIDTAVPDPAAPVAGDLPDGDGATITSDGQTETAATETVSAEAAFLLSNYTNQSDYFEQGFSLFDTDVFEA